MIDYNAIYTAVRVADYGSFTRASDVLQVPASTVSARVQELERRLGVKLFQRSTRRVRVTEAGQMFFEHARRGREAFDDAVTAAAQLAQRPRGLLHIVAPTLFARHLLPRLLPRFLAKYPDLKLTFDAVNRLPDLVEHGADVGIGVGPSRRATYIRRSLFSFSQAVYATPHFVARWGNPAKPDDLERVPLISLGTKPIIASWALVNGSQTQKIKVRPQISISDVTAIHGLTLAGIGAALLPEQLCQEDVTAGSLVRLLPDWSTQRVQVSAYYLRRRLEPEKVKVFLDHLIEWFGKPQAL